MSNGNDRYSPTQMSLEILLAAPRAMYLYAKRDAKGRGSNKIHTEAWPAEPVPRTRD